MRMENHPVGCHGTCDPIIGALRQPCFAMMQATGSIVPIDHKADGRTELVMTPDDGTSRHVFGVAHDVAGSDAP